jgi:hypothetical protein
MASAVNSVNINSTNNNSVNNNNSNASLPSEHLFPHGVDGSQPLDQRVHRMVAYVLPGLLGVFTAAWVGRYQEALSLLTDSVDTRGHDTRCIDHIRTY